MTISNSTGCSIQEVREVPQLDDPVIELLDSQAATELFGGGSANDGFLTIHVPNVSSGQFEVSWSNGSSSLNNTNLSSGNYFVTVTNLSTGCEATAQFNVPQCPTDLSFNISLNAITPNTTHNGGAIDIEVSGGNPPYTYAWSGPNFSSTSQDISGLPTGTFCVVVNDNCGRRLEECFPIIEECPTYQLDITVLNQCLSNHRVFRIESVIGADDGAIFTVEWDGPGIDQTDTYINGSGWIGIEPPEFGQYYVQITDENGCTALGWANFEGDQGEIFWATRDRRVDGGESSIGDVDLDDFIANAVITASSNWSPGVEDLLYEDYIVGLCKEAGCGCTFNGENVECTTSSTICPGHFCFIPDNISEGEPLSCNSSGKIKVPDLGYFDVPAGWGVKVEVGNFCGCVFQMDAFVDGGSPNAYSWNNNFYGPIHYNTDHLILAECNPEGCEESSGNDNAGNDFSTCIYYDEILGCYEVTYYGEEDLCTIVDFQLVEGCDPNGPNICNSSDCVVDYIEPFWCNNVSPQCTPSCEGLKFC